MPARSPIAQASPELIELRRRIRHSASHIMADAVLQLFPDAKYAIGPPTDEGFYYDFDVSRPFTPEDLERIEVLMRERIDEDVPFVRTEVSRDAAKDTFSDQPYKQEIIDGIPQEESIYTLQHGPFTDLCGGIHVERSNQVAAFKLLSVAAAYWRGDERRQMLQRIYGTAFESQEALDGYLEMLAEAERRDHRRVGRELDLYTSSELVGQGLPTLLPKGATVRRLLEEYVLGLERMAGYQHVYSPALGKVDLYKRSGHWDHYQENMFPPMQMEHDELVLRPMNCPHHILVYETQLHSYRDLPVRIAEFGTMYRYERSGVVGGLSRVRAMTLNDAHIFCTPDQIKAEFAGVMQLVEKVYGVLGITEYSYRLSLRDPQDTRKYVDNDAMWELGQRVLSEAMDELGLDYVAAEGEAAFYGPKLDIQIRDLLGREETMSTIQVDFHLPGQFGLRYIGEDGAEHRPVMLHRGVLGTAERMMAYLIELYGGAFPLWLAPVQAVVIPIADRHLPYADSVAARLRTEGLRVEVNAKSERMNAKIRDAQMQKVPYMLVVGDREGEANAAAVRLRDGSDLGAMALDEFAARMSAEVAAFS